MSPHFTIWKKSCKWSENFELSIFLDKSKKIGSNFLVQLASQISENNIQEFLIGAQFPKFKNQIWIPEIFLTFFVGRIKPRCALLFNLYFNSFQSYISLSPPIFNFYKTESTLTLRALFWVQFSAYHALRTAHKKTLFVLTLPNVQKTVFKSGFTMLV